MSGDDLSVVFVVEGFVKGRWTVLECKGYVVERSSYSPGEKDMGSWQL